MFGQVSQRNEAFRTSGFFAKEWSFTGVKPHMSFKVSIFCKGLFAYLTLKRFVGKMSINMNFESTSSLVSFMTNLTFIRLLTRVDHFVCCEMSLGDELLIAAQEITCKWPISSVRTQVNF